MKFDQQKIEDYVMGRLTEDEMDTFQFALMKDAELRKQVEAVRTLKYLARAQKRKKPRGIVPLFSRRLMRIAAIFIGLVTLAILLLLFNRSQDEPPFVKQQEQRQESPQNEIEDEQIVEDEAPPREQPGPQDSIETDIVDEPAPKPQSKEEPPHPLQKRLPEPPKEILVDIPVDTIPKDFDAPEIKKDSYVEELYPFEEIDFLDSFQFTITPGNLAVASTSIVMEIRDGDTITIGLAPQNYYVARMPRYPNGIFFDFIPSYPVGKNSIRTKDSTAMQGIPFLDSLYQLQPLTHDPIKLISKSNEFQELALTCKCGVIGKRYDNLVINIYSNREEEFKARKYRAGFACSEQTRIGFKIPNVELGLYYIVFEDVEKNEVLAVEKFELVTQDESIDEKSSYRNDWSQKSLFPARKAKPEHFLPNPTLESLIDSSFVANVDSLEIKVPLENSYRGGSVEVPVDLYTSQDSWPKARFNVYTNKASRFEKGKPIINSKVDFKQYESTIRIEYDKRLLAFPISANFRAGLYYIVLTSEDGEEIFDVSKFKVENE